MLREISSPITQMSSKVQLTERRRRELFPQAPNQLNPCFTKHNMVYRRMQSQATHGIPRAPITTKRSYVMHETKQQSKRWNSNSIKKITRAKIILHRMDRLSSGAENACMVYQTPRITIITPQQKLKNFVAKPFHSNRHPKAHSTASLDCPYESHGPARRYASRGVA